MSGGAGEEGGNLPARPPGRSLARADFEQVIRRAAELTSRDSDTEEMSETEIIRIATELGLPAHHVQRAMFELPELSAPRHWYDRYYDGPIISLSRVVPSQAPVTLKRLEEYLVTREYLQIARRRGNDIALIPAEDTISSIARAFTRSGQKHHLARASRVLVNVHPMPDDNAHVRLDVDLAKERASSASTAAGFGVVGGLIVGTAGAVAASMLMPGALGAVPEIVAFGGGVAGTFIASMKGSASRFHTRLREARLELTSLLDRLEQGDRLEPPAAPWRRRLLGRE